MKKLFFITLILFLVLPCFAEKEVSAWEAHLLSTFSLSDKIAPIFMAPVTIRDADKDSFIILYYPADDYPTIKMQSGSYYSLIQTGQAEGLAGADTRLGLDKSNRTFIICDEDDVYTDFGLEAWWTPSVYLFNPGATEYLHLIYSGFISSGFGLFSSGSFMAFVNTADLSIGNMFRFYSETGDGIIDTDGYQAYFGIDSTVKQGGTAAADCFRVDLQSGYTLGDGSTGDGNNLMRLSVGDTTKTKTDIFGNETQVGYDVLTPSSAQAITAVGDTILANAGVIVLDPDGDYTMTSAPTIADGTTGQILYITCGNAEANIVTVQDQGTLANSNLQLGAASRAISGKDVLVLIFDGVDWIEVSYANN